MFSGYRICDNLKPNEKCFRLFEYKDGEFLERFQEYVPSHRISADASVEFLRALLIKYSAFGDTEILRTFLNNRKGGIEKIQLGTSNIEYPEPGVLRKYFSSGPFTACFDEVISKAEFRSGNAS